MKKNAIQTIHTSIMGMFVISVILKSFTGMKKMIGHNEGKIIKFLRKKSGLLLIITCKKNKQKNTNPSKQVM